jgi:hypothetical protein
MVGYAAAGCGVGLRAWVPVPSFLFLHSRSGGSGDPGFVSALRHKNSSRERAA